MLCCWEVQVRCLLRVSVFHTAWLRGIFPDSYFKSVQAAGLDGEAPAATLSPGTPCLLLMLSVVQRA